jgi:hypothetical protein
MPSEEITRYNIEALVRARKVAMKTKLNTLYQFDPKGLLHERCLKVDLRRVDSPVADLGLEFYPRVKLKRLPGVASTNHPSAALMWKGKRIRGLDYKIRHDIVRNGLIEGYIKGWHEHYWTDTDEDANIRDPNPPVKNGDLQSIISWACNVWNIEGIDTQAGLYQ